MSTVKKITPKTKSKKQTPGYSANNTSTLNQVKLKKGGETKDKNWIQKAVNPAHKGYCTPMSKPTCTPKRKALARTFKKMAKNK